MILELNNMSLATSGSYRNYYYADSIKISHTINPKTLKPTHNKLISATILYSDCISADAYATACMAFESGVSTIPLPPPLRSTQGRLC